MPSEVVRDITPKEVTPSMGKEALGKWRALDVDNVQTQCWNSIVKPRQCRAGDITIYSRGVCRRVLKPWGMREGPPGKAAAANRTREIRPSGMRGGLTET